MNKMSQNKPDVSGGRSKRLATESGRTTPTSRQVSVAAEAIAASLFAMSGCDVFVQYGANQPEYDLMVVKNDKSLKVSVKGSQDDSWGLTQSFLKNADYHAAAEAWLAKHSSGTILCFVQFKNMKLTGMPTVYLATPREVAERLKSTANGRGDTILYVDHKWGPRAFAAGHTEAIPKSWSFSPQRIEDLLRCVPVS